MCRGWLLFWSLAVVTVTSLSAPIPARADATPEDVRRSSGLAIAAGVGVAVGGVGGQLSYYGEWGHPRLQLGGFVGMGHSFETDGPPRDALGVTLGAFGSFGRRTHRLYFDLAAMLRDSFWVGDQAFDRRYWVVATTVGYEILTRRGFVLRASIGPGVKVLRGTLWEPIDRFGVFGQLVMGWKLW